MCPTQLAIWYSGLQTNTPSAVQSRSPGRQMRPIDGTGNPYLHIEESVLRLINFRRIFCSLTTVCSLENNRV